MFAHGKPETVQLEFTRKGRESQISGCVRLETYFKAVLFGKPSIVMHKRLIYIFPWPSF